MEITVPPGKYVVAVSGGVDSIALLDLLRHQPGMKLIVAHFDHGIRPDSAKDRRLVQSLAKRYGLPFVYDEGHLGMQASEAAARAARYRFLHEVQRVSGARSVITAHHQDDALETAILNLLRGTGRKGLSALDNRPHVHRPLLHIPKRELIAHAQANGLVWREDSSNSDQRYRRNYIRHSILPRLNEFGRAELWLLISRQREVNREIDELLTGQLHLQDEAGTIDRRFFTQLPHAVSKELLAAWLRARGLADFDRRALERLTVAAKVAKPGKILDVMGGSSIVVGQDKLALSIAER